MPIILKENECVYCRTLEEFTSVCMTFKKQRVKSIKECWKKRNPCCVSMDKFSNSDNWGYSGVNYYKENGYRILSYYEFNETDPIKTYTQKEVDVIIAETRKKTIDEIIERLETINSTDSLVTANNYMSTSRCKTCGKFKSKYGKCKACKK